MTLEKFYANAFGKGSGASMMDPSTGKWVTGSKAGNLVAKYNRASQERAKERIEADRQRATAEMESDAAEEAMQENANRAEKIGNFATQQGAAGRGSRKAFGSGAFQEKSPFAAMGRLVQANQKERVATRGGAINKLAEIDKGQVGGFERFLARL